MGSSEGGAGACSCFPPVEAGPPAASPIVVVGSGIEAGFGGVGIVEQQVAFDLGLVLLVGQELRNPGFGEADALEQITRGLGHLVIQPAGPGGGEIILDDGADIRRSERLADNGSGWPPTSRPKVC